MVDTGGRILHLLSLVDAHVNRATTLVQAWTNAEEVPSLVLASDLDGRIASGLDDLRRTGLFVGPLECVDEGGSVLASTHKEDRGLDRSSDAWFTSLKLGAVAITQLMRLEDGTRIGEAVFSLESARTRNRPGVALASMKVSWGSLARFVREPRSASRSATRSNPCIPSTRLSEETSGALRWG